MSDSLPSNLFSSDQQRILALQAEIAELKAQKEGLARIATQTLSFVRALDQKVRFEGLWIQEADQAVFKEIEGGEVSWDSGKTRTWKKITEKKPERPKLPLYPNRNRHEIVPFKHPFPLEILEAILLLTDSQTIAVFARSSMGCLELFAPKVLVRISAPSPRSFHSLFSLRDTKLHARLFQAQSLHHIQVIEVRASTLEKVDASHIFTSRLEPGPPVLRLARLVIQIDFRAWEDPPPPPRSRPQRSADDSSILGSNLNDLLGITPQPTANRPLRCFRPQVKLLSLLDPETLVVWKRAEGRSTPWAWAVPDSADGDRSFRITRAAAVAISSWSRLKFIDLHDLDLFVLASTSIDDNDDTLYRDPVVRQDPKPFFLGLGGSEDALEQLSSNASTEWNLRWIVNKCNTVTPFEVNHDSLPHQLIDRDLTMELERVRSAKIVVQDEQVAEVVNKQIERWDEGCRGPLEVVVG